MVFCCCNPSSWFCWSFLPVKWEFFLPNVAKVLAHKGSSDFWSFACIIGGSLPYNTKCHEATVAVIWFYINLTELKLNLVFRGLRICVSQYCMCRTIKSATALLGSTYQPIGNRKSEFHQHFKNGLPEGVLHLFVCKS